MIKLSNLKIEYKNKRVIDGLDYTFEEKKFTTIVGESGTGKTSLALALLGLNSGKITGKILVDGEDLTKYTEKDFKNYRWNKVSIVFQNALESLNPMIKIIDQVTEPMIEHNYLDKKTAKVRALKLLKMVGLDEEHFNKYPNQVSGGQLQKVQIASAFSNDPDVLILDEPTSALDPINKKEIIHLLKDLCKEKTVIMITHDFSVARDLSNNILVLYGGRIAEHGNAEKLLVKPRHPYTRGLLRSYPNMSTTKDLQGIKGNVIWNKKGCPFSNRCTQCIDICHKSSPVLSLIEDRYVACHRGGIIRVIEGLNIVKNFDKNSALKGMSFSINEGETIAVVGESGSGKTTFAKCLMGLEKMDQGMIKYESETVKYKGRNLDFYRKVQMIYQNPRASIDMKLSILDVVKEPLDIQKIGTAEEKIKKVKKALKDVSLPNDDSFLMNSPEKLSGGELQRIAIARAMVLSPKVIIADEPTSALDVSVQAKIMKLLLDLQEKKGLSIIFITHDIALARKISDEIIVLKNGLIVENGMTPQVITKPISDYTKNLIDVASKIY